MFKTFKTIIAVAVAFTLVSTSAYSDAISKWAKGEFSLSTLSEKERIKELKWFQDAAKHSKECLSKYYLKLFQLTSMNQKF